MSRFAVGRLLPDVAYGEWQRGPCSWTFLAVARDAAGFDRDGDDAHEGPSRHPVVPFGRLLRVAPGVWVGQAVDWHTRGRVALVGWDIARDLTLREAARVVTDWVMWGHWDGAHARLHARHLVGKDTFPLHVEDKDWGWLRHTTHLPKGAV